MQSERAEAHNLAIARGWTSQTALHCAKLIEAILPRRRQPDRTIDGSALVTGMRLGNWGPATSGRVELHPDVEIDLV